MENDDEKSSKEFLDEFCFIVIHKEEEIDEDLQVTFEDIYIDFINVDKINKDFKL